MTGRAWVTGASGMLGQALTPLLKRSGWEFEAFSRTGRLGTHALDLSAEKDVEKFFKKSPPQVVIHSAAYSDVDGCERDPEKARAANAFSTKHLARLCGQSQVPLIYVSTDYVFSGRQKTPYHETDPSSPVNIYGLTKVEGEYYASRCAAGGAIVRTSWLFGGPNPANFVNAILKRLREEKEVSVLDDQTDCPTSVQDLSAALEKIAQRCLEKRGEVTVYHYCNSGATTRLAMTRAFQEWLKLPVTVRVADRASIKGRLAIRPEHCVMSCERFRQDFGIAPRPWQEAAREFVMGDVCAS